MNRDQEYIVKLLERFFEGRTTNAQEQELARYFASEEQLPQEWSGYRAMFEYLGSGLAADLQANARMRPATTLRRERVRERRIWYAGVAASLLVITVCLAVLIGKGPQPELGEFEGSYIVRNGVVITDAETVMPEIEATIREFEWLQQQVQQQWDEAVQMLQIADDAPERIRHLQAAEEIES